ncbi:MAG: Hsp70 family protein [Alphaproteobacteria bacterium]|nr:Hsp70 family protein [Alphaproteobacteria bacterium]
MYLGIDLGTSNSAIAAHIDGKLRILKTVDQGTDVLPSAIYIDKRKHKFYGHRAYEHLFRNPDNAADGFKRQMGTAWKKEFKDAGATMSAEECSAEILRQLVAQARVACGEREITGAVITTPAAFNQMQIAATNSAAADAGLEKIALLQEPVAAAMAAVADSKNKDGVFLVYDIGGGTFDLALVQSTKGNVSILAHEGINALGGRDFDRIIMNGVVRPWLLENYSLPTDYQKHDKYKKMIRIARMVVEQAKIELSKSESATIYMSEDDLRITDEDGADIFLEIPIIREKFDELIADQVDETIELSRKILKDNGYESEDLDRLVFIGGPSKIPALRERVAHELGLSADMNTDPMTAVALGAAIFCEGLDWSDKKVARKKTRGRATTKGAVQLQYDFNERVAEDRARIRIKPMQGKSADGVEIQIDSSSGWTSGRREVEDGITVELPLDNQGENPFRIMVFDKNGALVKDAGREIVITRASATAGNLRLPHNLAVVITVGEDDEARNTLHIFAEKGKSLPANGLVKDYRAARDLRDGDASIFVQFYEQPEKSNPTPAEPNRFIGKCEIEREALSTDIEKGDELGIRWDIDESQRMKFEVVLIKSGEVSGEIQHHPSAVDYGGESGEELVGKMLAEAKSELQSAEKIATASDATNIRKIQNALEKAAANLEESEDDAEERRAIAEKIRDQRQKIAAIRNSPQNRVANLLAELQKIKDGFDADCRENADAQTCERFDSLFQQANAELAKGDGGYEDAKRSASEMQNLCHRELWNNPGFIVGVFKYAASKKDTAMDGERHDQLVETGTAMLDANDISGLRRIIGELFDNQLDLEGGAESADSLDPVKLSDLMRR